MKTLPPAALAALQSGNPVIAGAVRLSFSSGVYRLWSGVGDLPIAGEAEPFAGIGARGAIVPVSAEIGSGSDGVRLTLSGLEPRVAQAIEAEDYHQRPCVIWRLVFDAPGVTLLAASVYFRGRVDQVAVLETVGGEASIVINVEGGLRDFSRRGARMRADVDQRTLAANDGGFKHVTIAGQRTLYWGQKPASANAVLNGGSNSGYGRGIDRDNANLLL